MIKRGDVYYADLDPVRGSEQGGTRPVLVVQNDLGNKYSSTTIVVAAVSTREAKTLPTHVEISLPQKSTVLLEQIRTIDKKRLMEKICTLSRREIEKVNEALKVSLGLKEEVLA